MGFDMIFVDSQLESRYGKLRPHWCVQVWVCLSLSISSIILEHSELLIKLVVRSAESSQARSSESRSHIAQNARRRAQADANLGQGLYIYFYLFIYLFIYLFGCTHDT